MDCSVVIRAGVLTQPGPGTNAALKSTSLWAAVLVAMLDNQRSR